MVLWVDDEILPKENDEFENHNQKMLHWISSVLPSHNFNFVLKPSTKLANSYINSSLF